MLRTKSCWACDIDLVTCECSRCGRHEEVHGTVSETASALLKQGWTMKSGQMVSSPLTWVCPSCSTGKAGGSS